MPRLLLATTNAHKTSEFRALLPDWDIADLSTHPEYVPPEETGTTFEANAIIKVIAASRLSDDWTLADDSGLEVDALQGAPGVYSARYAGPEANDLENRMKLLRELSAAGARGKARSARFRCVLAIARNGAVQATFAGAAEGMINNAERGAGGFGYDPLFIPEGYCQTFAELDAATKNLLSHRGHALNAAAEFLAGLRESR
ncbi:MAG TPA: RdgB/HAM1 family non-canonical purine NTP pyrophosphatase [Chthoniobacteraceae bacterium]|nr:RdgB/HAM1 family non-canonical purine NTP pyrophosphatase [Chthoniobacteraceae bacterium]